MPPTPADGWDIACSESMARAPGGISMPDTPELQRHFGQPGMMKVGCGFPVAHLLVMIDAATGLIIEMIGSCWKRHDASLLIQLHRHLRGGDVILGDRGFCSYTHLALLLAGRMHAVMRLHQRIVANFTPHRRRRDRGGEPCLMP